MWILTGKWVFLQFVLRFGDDRSGASPLKGPSAKVRGRMSLLPNTIFTDLPSFG